MSFYESLCHSFGTLAIGGFSTKNASVGYYSPYLQYVIAIFMVLSGMNFTLHYFLIKGNFQKLYKNSELKLYLTITLIVTHIISGVLVLNKNYSIEHASRESFFQFTSMLTTTGYATADYLNWPTQGWILIFTIMFVGGCVCSTAGGIKVIRRVVAFKYLRNQIAMILHPKAIMAIKVNSKSIQDSQEQTIITFIMMYMAIFAAGFVFMTLLGLDMCTAMGSVIACLGSFGPGIGTVGPAANFAHIPEIGKVVLFVLMIIGRHELLTFMILLMPEFWRKKTSE